ncbi:MAG TPA: hypothetical protein VM286_06450 [Candidatus Thermoplasmatota archaeon]|nr:hypothetical protein [Candidatus Thermoplasmatota archaeon]
MGSVSSVLLWISRHQERKILWDSDLMMAFGWDAGTAQGTLRSLQGRGWIRTCAVTLPTGELSMGVLQVTRRGRHAGHGMRADAA